MHPSEWVGVLFNLHTNARKAQFEPGGKIHLRLGRRGEKGLPSLPTMATVFPKRDQERIFNAFFTRTAGRYA